MQEDYNLEEIEAKTERVRKQPPQEKGSALFRKRTEQTNKGIYADEVADTYDEEEAMQVASGFEEYTQSREYKLQNELA